jgi:hypothetical protein
MVFMSIFFILALITIQPACAETPVCRLSGTDLAPKTIYTGDSYNDNLNDIAMLQITFNTSWEGNITINHITLHKTGQSSDMDVNAINLFEDVNHNKEFDPTIDIEISSSTFELGKVDLLIEMNITQTQPLSVIVTMDISEDALSNSNLGVEIPDESYIDYEGVVFTEFEFPVLSKNSTIHLDTDGDTNPDMYDPDDDNDRYTDDIEILVGTNPKDPGSIPSDYDLDYVPDTIDTDDDNDGVLDKYDDFPKDEDRQKDYTVVILYLVIAIILIFVMIIILNRGRQKILDIDDKDEFKIDKKSKVDLDEDTLDDELIEDL